ncbi:YbaK/EbsC family protein [Anoxynatronum buryatiense]|uniref:Cys-tRNA(Pro) deacylase, prolyl-tRNA editing enzyme YbaK/EbsC n=1 Tax=Anoxynatronum buryatiense TaxID=489973 RepID=A0AA45WWT1_9CLOT|nr:YbaK/EbsC family protein [Anoxynatronum buryatiense]SMP61399.1 Cys-tRNA(Pro) deacylase, prolyl-tRNA editing enzyme YbaK/EbsC [Anoxynatronum buryatiense]
MAVQDVRNYLGQWGLEEKVMEMELSSATVELAAEAVGVIPARIAKTLSFKNGDGCLLIVTAGDAKIDNAKFKARFGMKAKMLSPEEVVALTGHPVGGVCPFALKEPGIQVFTDVSMKRFETVFPACGSGNSAIELTCEQLYETAGSQDWIDVCKGWNSEA